MTEENMEVQVEDTTTPAPETAEENVHKAETVFLVTKELDGTFRVFTDLSQKISVSRPANISDVKTASHEVYVSINNVEIARSIAGALKPAQPASE